MRHARARHYQREVIFSYRAYVYVIIREPPNRNFFLPTCRDDFGNFAKLEADQ